MTTSVNYIAAYFARSLAVLYVLAFAVLVWAHVPYVLRTSSFRPFLRYN